MEGRPFVLVVSADQRLERLALCAVRAAGCHPMLPHVDEECPVALRRILPDVVLLDSSHPCASSSDFFGDASKLGVRVIALAPDGRDLQARAVARRQNADCVTLPTEYDLIPQAIRAIELPT